MRVALFTETFLPKVDGITRVLQLTLEHFQRRSIETVVVAHDLGVREYAGARVIGVPGLPVPFYPELRFGPPHLGTYRQVKAFRPDVVHLVHPFTLGGGGVFMARRLGVPFVSSFHTGIMSMARFFRVGPVELGFLEPLLWSWTRWSFNAADARLATSRRVQQELMAHGVKPVGLWRRGVDAEKFNPRYRDAAMREALSDGHPDDTILIYVGRLSPEKQIEQVRAVLEGVPGTRLAIVGGGPYRATLEQHFAGLPVTFTGYLRGEALSQAYASADIFVFPSAWESFGLVVVEAMAAGLPVVASRVGGVEDMVEEGRTGCTFEVDDVAGLVDGVRFITAAPGRRAEMGRAARAFAETQSWPVMMDELLDHYRAVIETRRTNSG